MVERKWGWKKDLPDPRDPKYRAPRIAIPAHVDLRGGCSPVEDQGNLGSCTANALAGALEFLEIKNEVPFKDFSRLMLYFAEREQEGTINEDGGAMLRTGVKVLEKQGVCYETTWPYNIEKFTVKPDKKSYKEAEEHQITSYQRIEKVGQLFSCLASGYPIAFGFVVFDFVKSEKVAKSGILPMPTDPEEQALGGHAVLMVGYDMKTEHFIIRNSWGPKWGDKGYFYMPFGYIEEGYCADFWTIRKGEGM